MVDTRLLNFDRENMRVVTRDDDGEPVLPSVPERVRILDEREGLLLAIRSGDDPYAYLIPCYEILRFFYCPTITMANGLFLGWMLDSSRYIFDPEKTQLDPAARRIRVQLRPRIEGLAVNYVALLASSQLAMERAIDVFHWLAKCDEKYRPIRALPPVGGVRKCRFRFVPYQVNGWRRSVITKLEECDVTVPFDQILWDRDNNNIQGENKDDKDLPANSFRPRPRDLNPQLLEGDDGPASPLPDRAVLAHADVNAIFPQYRGVTKERLPKKIQKTRSARGRSKESHATVFTPEVGTSVHSDHGQFTSGAEPENEKPETRPKDVTDERDKTLSKLIDTLRAADKEKLITARFLSILPVKMLYRSVPCDAFKARLREKGSGSAKYFGSWFFIDDKGDVSRMFLVVEIRRSHDSGRADEYRYLIDAEARYGNRCSMLIVYRKGGRLASSELRQILRRCAEHKTLKAPERMSGVKSRRLRHVDSILNPKNFEKLIQRIFEEPTSDG